MSSIKHFATIICLFLVALTTFAQNIPDKPYPFRFVNDYAGVMSDSIISMLESQLVDLHFSSSDQIAVVTVKSFDGEIPALYAQALGQKWGIGQKGKDNGVVIIVKPKTETENGEAFIATGYGQESALTDAMCTRIVNEGMIPYFKNNDYCGGIRAGVACVISVIKGGTMEEALDEDYSVGESTIDNETIDYDDEDVTWWEIVLVLALILIFIYIPCWCLGLIFQFFKALFSWDWSEFKSFWSILGFGLPVLFLFLSGSGSGSGGSSGGYSSGGGSFGGGGGGGSW